MIIPRRNIERCENVTGSVDTFRKNIRTIRLKRGLKQEDMAEGLGIQPTISKYETGASSISLDLAIRYSEFFGISIDNLCSHDYSVSDRPHPDLSVRNPNASEDARRLFRDKLLFFYYLSASGSINEGFIDLDPEFDMVRRFLHGEAVTKNRYDCKLVIEGKESVYIYGTELSETWRFMIMFPYPKGYTVYSGGTGILVHKDEGDNLSGQKVVVSEKKLDVNEGTSDYEYVKNQLGDHKSSTDRNEDVGVRNFTGAGKKRIMTEQGLSDISFRDVMGYEPEDEDFPLDTAHVFRMGICHLFAKALADRFGYETIQVKKGRYLHCFCRHTGKYIDALGVSSNLPNIGIEYETNEMTPMEPIENDKYTEIGMRFATRFVKMYRDVYEVK